MVIFIMLIFFPASHQLFSMASSDISNLEKMYSDIVSNEEKYKVMQFSKTESGEYVRLATAFLLNMEVKMIRVCEGGDGRSSIEEYCYNNDSLFLVHTYSTEFGRSKIQNENYYYFWRFWLSCGLPQISGHEIQSAKVKQDSHPESLPAPEPARHFFDPLDSAIPCFSYRI